MNYTQLKLDIQSWTNNNNAEITAALPTLVSLGQKKLEDILIKEGIALPMMEAFSSAITPSVPLGSNNIALPSDYLKMIYLQLTDELPSPVNAAFTSGAGTLAAGTYYYRVSAINVSGETIPSVETSLVVLINKGVNVNWAAVVGATGYKIYGRTTGAEALIATVGVVTTYFDSGSITPNGIMPVLNTTGTLKYPRMSRQTSTMFAADFVNSINNSVTGRPQFFDRLGDMLYFNIYADKAYAYALRYAKRITSLSEAVQTNYWTDKHYNALLYSCLVEIIPFLGDDPRGTGWLIKRNAEIADIKAINEIERRSGSRLLREK